MTMNKVKSPLVKILRKAGYSVKEAMNITLDAQYNFHNQRCCTRKHFNCLAIERSISAMFTWVDTREGRDYWHKIQVAVNRK